MSLISVIVPVYNVQQYLRECIDSVINQTFQDVEIICINDGSTDDSAAILEEYAQKDSRIILKNQGNKGQAAARNAGLKIAKGKYIAFVDGDDWIDAEMFASLTPLLTNDIDAIIFDVNVFGERDKCMQKYFHMKFRGKLMSCGDVIFGSQVSPWNKIYRRDIIDKYGISFPNGLLYEDNSFHWKYLMHASNVYFYPKKLYNYRIRKNSTMNETKAKRLKVTDHFFVCLDIFEYMKKYNLTEKFSASFVRFFEHCLGIVCVNASDSQKSMEIANDVWSKIDIPTDNAVICALKRKNYDYVTKWIGYSFWEKMFSIKKRYGKKVITVCGAQF